MRYFILCDDGACLLYLIIGSGKSYTMFGTTSEGASTSHSMEYAPGMVQYALRDLFEFIELK